MRQNFRAIYPRHADWKVINFFESSTFTLLNTSDVFHGLFSGFEGIKSLTRVNVSSFPLLSRKHEQFEPIFKISALVHKLNETI